MSMARRPGVSRSTLFGALILFVTLASPAGAADGDRETAAIRDLPQLCARYRSSHRQIFDGPRDKRAVAAKDWLDKLEPDAPVREDPGRDVLAYYRARLLIIAGENTRARQELAALVDNVAVGPEALVGLIESFEWSPLLVPPDRIDGPLPFKDMAFVKAPRALIDTRMRLETLLGEVLPTDLYGRLADRRGTVYRSLAEQKLFGERPDNRLDWREGEHARFSTDRPIIPHMRPRDLSVIATEYNKMRMPARVADTYRELIYGCFVPPRAKGTYFRGESWLSPKTAPLWLKAAAAELAAGRVRVARNYVAKALLFGDEKARLQGRKLLAQWERHSGDKGPPKPRAGDREEIARRYAAMNMHTRALRVLADCDWLSAERLKGRCQREWITLVERYCAGTATISSVKARCTLFGANVVPDDWSGTSTYAMWGRWLQIWIPFPCEEDALTQAAAEVRKLIESAEEDED